MVDNCAVAKILIVDDSGMIRALSGDLLRAAGHDVEEAHNGVEALSRVDRGGIDLILLDVNMSVMTGFQTLESLKGRAGQGTSGPKVLVMTDIANSPDDVARARVLGANGFLAKAALKEQLVFRVHTLLGLPAPAPA